MGGLGAGLVGPRIGGIFDESTGGGGGGGGSCGRTDNRGLTGGAGN